MQLVVAGVLGDRARPRGQSAPERTVIVRSLPAPISPWCGTPRQVGAGAARLRRGLTRPPWRSVFPFTRGLDFPECANSTNCADTIVHKALLQPAGELLAAAGECAFVCMDGAVGTSGCDDALSRGAGRNKDLRWFGFDNAMSCGARREASSCIVRVRWYGLGDGAPVPEVPGQT